MNTSVYRRLALHVLTAGLVLAGALYLAVFDKGTSQSLAKQVDKIGVDWHVLLITLASVSTLAVAFVEALKAIGDLQCQFHAMMVRRWIVDDAVRDELLFLAAGDRGRADALFGQAIEKMMGQVQAAATMALDFPLKYPQLYGFLTKSDLDDRGAADRDIWASHVQNLRRDPQDAIPDRPKPSPEQIDAAQARARLSNFAARKLDAFQLRTSYYWDRSNQLAAMIVSAAITLTALDITWHNLFVAFVAGVFAPFVKDLSSGLTGFLKKS